ncbi:MAG: Phenolic acid decarboxylase subunit B [Deltaproteobacteria bacterium ADurb.Bin510]|nr:MAG: Phenolic acid decarboxylase subunit B [Deltaproteobacteria bacterium ADurb.Bin510]
MKRVIIGLSGASGTIYAANLLEHLAAVDCEIHLIASATAAAIFVQETGQTLSDFIANLDGQIIVHANTDLAALPASGSFVHAGMVIAPCSMRSLAAVATGLSDSLLTRAADVCLKERRPLIMMTRETPLSLIHIENMRQVTLAGATVMPASPGFYHQPQTIKNLADFMSERVLMQLGIQVPDATAWKG